MRVKDAAIRLDVSSATIYGLIAAGKLRCHRLGLGRGCIRISEEHLSEFLRGAEKGFDPPSAPTARIIRPTLRHLKTD